MEIVGIRIVWVCRHLAMFLLEILIVIASPKRLAFSETSDLMVP
jgi:hypothetical protein